MLSSEAKTRMFQWLWWAIPVLSLLGISYCWMVERPSRSLVTNQIINPGFESVAKSTDSLEGWSVDVQSGSYRCRVATGKNLDRDVAPGFQALEYCRSSRAYSTGGPVHSGEKSMECAGCGGAVTILANPVEFNGHGFVECAAWLKSEFDHGAICTVDVIVPEGHVAEADREAIEVDHQDCEWRQITLFKEIEADSASQTASARLVVRLQGEGLIRVDDAEMRVFTRSANFNDSGFESAKSRYLRDWSIASDKGNNDCKVISGDAHGGDKCIRLEGNDGWKVLYTRHMSDLHRRFIVQAFVKVREGLGGVKIEYFGGGQKNVQSYLIPKSDEWTRILLTSNPEFMKTADSFCVTLVATRQEGDGELYSVDVDDVELFKAN